MIANASVKGTSLGNATKDDIFIDDDGAALEGSGAGHHEVKDDLESSGSGYGPDDEDGDGGSGDIILPSILGQYWAEGFVEHHSEDLSVTSNTIVLQ
uniref:Uncharacterized protein n=1 Tax=Timema poppense TaxID=170557 RepID=A0A7R9D711_TIMPO|nr:unnamed protein product [Timema poppensis]